MSSAALTGEAPSGPREVEFSIQGVTCVARVEKKLNTIENVFASVNFATEKATVAVPASVAVQQLIEKTEQAGYGAEVVGPASGAAGGGPDDARVAYLRRRPIVALVFFVTAGTVAVSGRLIVRAARVGKDTQLAHLVALVEQAQAQKAAIQRPADRISGVFVPVVLTVAGLTLAGWLLAGAPSAFVVFNSVRLRRFKAPAVARRGWWPPPAGPGREKDPAGGAVTGLSRRSM